MIIFTKMPSYLVLKCLKKNEDKLRLHHFSSLQNLFVFILNFEFAYAPKQIDCV